MEDGSGDVFGSWVGQEEGLVGEEGIAFGVGGEVEESLADFAEVILAVEAIGAFAGFDEHGDDDAEEQEEDGNDGQELDKSQTLTARLMRKEKHRDLTSRNAEIVIWAAR